jgi:hypothetical protein
MKYQTPKMTVIDSPITVIQESASKPFGQYPDNPPVRELIAAYEDWE